MRSHVLAAGAPPSPEARRSVSSWGAWLEQAFATTPARFWHSRAVWHRAAHATRRELRHWSAPDRDALVLAALLHDVGRALDPRNTAPHGFVGAAWLDELGMHDVARLVAHHSGARHEAEQRDMAHLDAWPLASFTPAERDGLAVLTYLDRTTNPAGIEVTADERRTDLVRRFGGASLSVASFDASLADVRRGRDLLAVTRWPAPAAALES
jgi:putative nucleotidyltransferase with HDIG domain